MELPKGVKQHIKYVPCPFEAKKASLFNKRFRLCKVEVLRSYCHPSPFCPHFLLEEIKLLLTHSVQSTNACASDSCMVRECLPSLPRVVHVERATTFVNDVRMYIIADLRWFELSSRAHPRFWANEAKQRFDSPTGLPCWLQDTCKSYWTEPGHKEKPQLWGTRF